MKKVACLLGWLLLGAVTANAQAGLEPVSDLSSKAFAAPALGVTQSPKRLQDMSGFERAPAWERFQARISPGRPVYALFDPISQRPAIVELSLPWIPGAANRLRPEEVAGFGREPIRAILERLGRDFVREHEDLLGVSEEDLILDKKASQGTRPVRAGERTDFRLWHLVFNWAPHGVPVEGAKVVFRVSNGNLIQLATQALGDREDVPREQGRVGKEQARKVLERHVGGFLEKDRMIEDGVFRILSRADVRRSFRPAWFFSFERGRGEVWEGAVDSITGELLFFGGTAVEGYASGKVRTHGNPTTEVLVPFPLVDYRDPEDVNDPQAPVSYSGMDGFMYNFGEVSSKLQGKTITTLDDCRENGDRFVLLTGYDLNFGGVNSAATDDCNSNGGGPGNTSSARTAYYHLTHGKEWVRGYMPQLPWLDIQTLSHTNMTDGCSAQYVPQNDDFQFNRRYDSGAPQNGVTTKCRSNGDIVSLILHEFGHGVDYNDGNDPKRPNGTTDGGSAEAYGDIVAFLTIRDSCLGQGLDLGSIPPLCGRNCTSPTNCQVDYTCAPSCTGFREVDWRAHGGEKPHTPETNLSCMAAGNPNYTGPCGLQPHCETAPATEAMWDLVLELMARGYSENDAWEKAADLFLSSRPSGEEMFTCENATGSREGGTPAGSLYHTLRAADDDCDGNPNDGTANAAAIYAALARHEIAVGSASDPRNQNDPCDEAPVANFTYSCSGRTCTFNGSSSTDDFGISSWTWSFGDGTPAVTESDPSIIHTYATSNHFQVTLTVRDTLNQPGSTVQFVTANQLPTADFTFNCNGLSCSVDASGSTDDNPITSYLWSWGDGTPNTGFAATATHTFAVPGSYTVTVTVTDSLGGQAVRSKLVSVINEAAPAPAGYFAVAPCRLLDTRTTSTPLISGVARLVTVTGACGIPASARAVSFNIAVVGPTGNGNLSFYPGNLAAGASTSSINFQPATSPRANNAILRLATNGAGTLGIYPSVFAGSPAQVHVILDVDGYFSEDAAPAPGAQGPFGFQTITPCRLADTRPSSPIAANTSRTFTVQGACGVPAGAIAASLNFTAAQATGGGFATLYTAGTAVPGVSTINVPNGTVALANGARTRLAPTTPDLAVHFAAPSGAVHAVLDTNGYFSTGTPLRYRPLTPCRAVDTRSASQGGPSAVATGAARSFQIRGNCGVPLRAKAAFLNVTVLSPTAGGHLSAFPAGTALPAVPNLTFDAGEAARSNGMIVPLSTASNDLSLHLFAPPTGSAHVVVDVFGWFDDPPPTACFTYSCNLRSCTFDGSCSSDNQSVSNWSWNLGDGSPVRTGPIITHNYAAGGPKTVTLTVTDNVGQPDDEIKIVPVNRPPVANPDAANTPPGLATDINVLANDNDPDNDPITVSWWSPLSVQGGTVSKNVNGTLHYVPPAGYLGPDSFTYRISDGKEESGVATVSVSVNNPPDARDDGWAAIPGNATNIPYSHLLANDYDPNGDALTVTGVNTAGLIGTLDCSSGTYCRYTPPGFQGATSFTYTASDGKGGTDTATVRIKVGMANGLPVPQDDILETAYNTNLIFTRDTLLLNDSDPNGDVLSITSVYRAPLTALGTVSCSAAHYVCTYTPPAGFTGVDVLWYRASDGIGFTDARIRILVRPPSPAVLDAREDQTFFTSVGGTFLSYTWMTSNDHDPEGGALTVVSVDTTGLLGSLDCTTYPTGCQYTRGTSDPTRFRYTVRDPQGNLATTTVTLKPGNWSFNLNPVITNDQLSTRMNTPLVFSIFDVLRNDYDPDNDQLNAMFSFGSPNGRVLCSASSYVCTYTPNTNFTGTDTLTYYANDGNNAIQGAVTMTVQPLIAKDAQILSQSVPVSMFAGQSYPVSLRIKNVGTTAWSPIGPQCNAFRLGSVNPYNNTTWNSGRTELPAAVAPGGEVTLNFTVTAPSTPGTYNFQRQMVQECVVWVGDLSPNVVVSVSP